MRSNHFWALRERLLREGVAPKHVRRTVTELEAHRQDIVVELRDRGVPAAQAEVEARARLGSDDALAASVLARPELRSWARKRPWAAFTIVPVVSFVAAFALWAVVFVMLVEALKSALGMSLLERAGVRAVAEFLFGTALWGMPTVIGGLCMWFAGARRAGAAWPVVGVAVISLTAAAMNLTLEWPAPPDMAEFSAGIGIGPENALQVATRSAFTMALVLVPFFAWRRIAQTGRGRAS
jgi:hypothetical protein